MVTRFSKVLSFFRRRSLVWLRPCLIFAVGLRGVIEVGLFFANAFAHVVEVGLIFAETLARFSGIGLVFAAGLARVIERVLFFVVVIIFNKLLFIN